MIGTPNDILSLNALLTEVLLRVLALEGENGLLKEENMMLKAENEELKRRLGLNSTNSHKPPCSEGYKKSPALKKAGGGLVGGQKGHAGHTLEMRGVGEVDSVVVHRAERCSCCGRLFGELEAEHVLYRRQVFDIPVPKLEIMEHQVVGIVCCGETHVGHFPGEVKAPVQYGIRLKALAALLNTDFRLPFGKISQLFQDLYGYDLSEGTLTSANEAVFEALAPVEADIKAAVLASEVVHFDETGMRVEGELHWFHTACTSLVCYLYVHKKRGKEALEAAESVIKDFTNWAIHDCWSSYFPFTGCKHALCNAHILRELTALIENGSLWAGAMHKLLLEIYLTSQKGTQILPNKAQWYEKYTAICEAADKEEPIPIKDPKSRGKPKNTKGRNLLNRLVTHQDGVLAFAFQTNIPFTNNQAERDIRHVKVKQKVAMSFRTLHGAKVYARIQSFVATTRKKNQNTFSQLCNVLQGKEYLLTIPE